MPPRLRAELWVRAYLKRLELNNIPAYIAAKGQPDSGAVMVKCATLDGQAKLYTRRFDLMTDSEAWAVLTEGPEREVDESIRKQRSFDPDLWVIELEARHGRTLLEEDGLKD
uniref:GTP-binding protein Era n=1 Tax=Rhodobacter aestuarii TaxID=453582 RepID=A0A1N7N526_9RHOB|nr:DUF1491 family protein [Rhodobacter aestuarii]PTV96231.1 hypothetical protein C8J27_10225 [Rhodobacter aestuarii]SIS93261.1 hypothetical protein SAMN05421580_10725 [Rhodobacter aestuarii]